MSRLWKSACFILSHWIQPASPGHFTTLSQTDVSNSLSLTWSAFKSEENNLYLLSFSKNVLQVGHMLTSQTWLPCSVTSPGTSWAWPSPCRRCPRRTRSTWASPAGWRRLWWPLRPARCSGCTRWRRHCQTATWCCSRGRRSQWSAGPAWCTAASGSSFLVCRQWRFLSGRRGW